MAGRDGAQVFGAEPSPAGDHVSDPGFALVDSLIALVILSIAIGLALDAGRVALRASIQARQIVAASGVLGELMEGAEPNVTGLLGAQAWWLVYHPAVSQGPARLCRRTATVGRAYSEAGFTAETIEPCPPEPTNGR